MTSDVSAERPAPTHRGADEGGDAPCWAHEFDEYLGLSDVPASGGSDGEEAGDANDANDANDGRDDEP